MATTLNIIERSLRLLGVYAPGDRIPAAEAQDALDVLNRLVTDWRLEELLVYTVDRQVFSVVANTQSYTVGPTGVWVMERPDRLDQVNWQYPVTLVELPLRAMQDQEYQNLLVRTVTGGQPIRYYYGQEFPNATLFFWPNPTTAGNAVLFAQHPWTGTASLTTTVSLPPGYQAAMEYNLAVELSPEYPRASGLNPVISQQAERTKRKIKAINEDPPLLSSDAARLGHSWQTGRGGGTSAWAAWLAGEDGA